MAQSGVGGVGCSGVTSVDTASILMTIVISIVSALLGFPVGGYITYRVSQHYYREASRDLETVADALRTQIDSLKFEAEKLQSATKGLVAAMEKPGEIEAEWNPDGIFKGWRVTMRLYTAVRFVDEHGNPVNRPQPRRPWWQRMLRGWL